MAAQQAPHDPGRGNRPDEPAPPGADPSVPSPARMYDYYLGGRQNYPADRAAAERALSVVPNGRQLARANRYFLMRAALLMADSGIRQFIDLGMGIPTKPSVHELAQAICPDAHVVYVDNDPVVIAHARAILAGRSGVDVIEADIRDPAPILASTELARLIDFSEPVGLLLVAVLHFISDSDGPERIVRAFTDRMIPGSYLALSHAASDGTDPGVITTIQDAYASTSVPAVFRTSAEISALLHGFDLISPGLADVTQWSPYGAYLAATAPSLRCLAAIGCKP